MIQHFMATGKVKSIMFRQTLVRAAQKCGLKAGVSNVPLQADRVRFALEGDERGIKQVLAWLQSGMPLNSWGAMIEHLEPDEVSTEISHYQVTTDNVDTFRWNPNIKLYLDDLNSLEPKRESEINLNFDDLDSPEPDLEYKG